VGYPPPRSVNYAGLKDGSVVPAAPDLGLSHPGKLDQEPAIFGVTRHAAVQCADEATKWK
jgi:hypothetical protein